MLDLVHYLHLLSGTIWAGGAVFTAFVVEPALLRLEPQAIRTFLPASGRFAGPLMATSGIILLLSAIGRTWLGGGISSFADLGSPYGLYAILALVLVLAVTIAGGRHRARVIAILKREGDPRPALARNWRSQAAVTGVGILAILAVMTILGMGLY
jgi:putative copper export protein